MHCTVRSPLTRCAALAICLLLVSQDAFTWGPRARRAIAAGAISHARGNLGDIVVTQSASYEADVIRGAVDGLDALQDFAAFRNEVEAVDSVMNEIDLLAKVKTRGVGSYFSYRLGALSALVAQITIPYGFPQTPEEQELYAQISADLERYVEGYAFDPHKSRIGFVTNPQQYFNDKRPFLEDDRTMIREEYARGQGYEGFLDDAGPAYFQRSVEAVADAWNTIVSRNPSVIRREPPAAKLAEYYIDEIRYQLHVNDSIAGADRAYRDFAEVNPGKMDHYLVVGDLYYDFGTDVSKERAVHEWKIAQKSPGAHVRAASTRLSEHYLRVGQTLFDRSQTPEALDTDLEDSRRAFQTALEFDGTSELAANAISEATAAINRRRELYDQQQTFIENALAIRENAERSLLNQDFVDALASFHQALDLSNAVGTEFADLQEQAKDISSGLQKDIKTAISDLFDLANTRIQEADKNVAENKLEDAINIYKTVQALLADLPEDEGSIETQRKLEMLSLLSNKLEEAEVRLKNQQAAGKRSS